MFTLPAAGVREAIEACARRKVGSAMVFAAGFAEVGEQEMQDEIAKTARDGGLAIVGPNCLGVTNNVDGMMLHMLFAREALRGVEAGVAFVGQSGGMLGHFQRAADGRGTPLSYVISTGNETAGIKDQRISRRRRRDQRDGVIPSRCVDRAKPSPPAAARGRRKRCASRPVAAPKRASPRSRTPER